MRRFNLFSRGMTSLFKLAVRLLVIALSVSLRPARHAGALRRGGARPGKQR